MKHIYHFAHIGLETWEKEPIKVIMVSGLSSHCMGNRIMEIEGQKQQDRPHEI